MAEYVFLTTERLVLRPFAEADLDDVLALHGDPEVMRFINGGRPASRTTIRDEILPRLTRHHATFGTRGFWAAEDRTTGRFLGWFELRPLADDGPEVVELGYRLHRFAWGRGHATEGARALVHKGFTELGVRRVIAQTMAVNTASRRVLEKTGLTYVRTFHEDWPDPIAGAEHGEVEYALTETDRHRRLRQAP
ncbi:GNAT family N-acetyltransferase [Actinoallomurus sp. CA-150999]|uniref:GNAT family N-acetyltransferase n=1 Tax=Actinoallomurus sp. CA-150999 TaxID=3239887 RepID=UPI003D942C99